MTEELFGTVIAIAISPASWAAWGPRAMLGVIATPVVLWLGFCVYAVYD